MAESLRTQLLSAASAGSSAFEISGVLELSKPLEVYFKDHNNQLGSVNFPLSGNDPTELQPLLDACSPAMFGLGRQTLHNEAVRKALQLPANKLGLNLGSSLPSQAIMEDVGAMMMPEAAGPIRVEVYALNVYSPDGFFKAHRDTPASPDMFGSLIFCLPTEFTGGELIIRSPDLSTSVTHDWGSTSSARLAAAASGDSCGELAWAAMYSDCEHEIKPVTTGHRVTLTYNLYRPASGGDSSSQDSGGLAASAAAARESAFGVHLAAALSDATWYPAGVTLGLALEHFYAVETLEECSERAYAERSRYGYESDEDNDESHNMPDSIEPGNLKGADLQLYRAARALGLDVMVVPVVSLDRFNKWDLKYPSYEKEAPSRPLSPGKLAVMKSFKSHPGGSEWDPNGYFRNEGIEDDEDNDDNGDWETYDDSWAKYLQKNIAERSAVQITGDLVWVKLPGKQHLKYCGNVSKYKGNSGCTVCYYAAAALLLTVPPVGAPARQG